VRLLAGVAPDDIADLLAASEELTLEAGEALLMPGMCNIHLYLLLSGQLRVAPVSPDGDDGWLLEAGEAVGELAMINRQPISAYVLAEQPSRLLVVPHETFWALADVSHAVARNLLINLGRHLRQADTGVARSERLQKHYLQSAGVDDPTGLRNQRWFEHTLRRQALRSHFAVTPLSLVVVHIDGYADYCNHFGAEAGDAPCTRWRAPSSRMRAPPTSWRAAAGRVHAGPAGHRHRWRPDPRPATGVGGGRDRGGAA